MAKGKPQNKRKKSVSYEKYGYLFILPFFLVYFIFSFIHYLVLFIIVYLHTRREISMKQLNFPVCLTLENYLDW